jgi:hypothetical protein
MDVRMYDPAVDEPQNPNSPIQIGDPADCHPLASDPTITECSAPGP